MRYVLVSAAAAMALVGAATIGNAQAPDDKGKGPAAEGKGSAQEKAPPQREPGAAKQAPQAAPGRSEPRAEGRTEPKSEPRKGAQRDTDKDQPRKGAQRDMDKDRPKAAERQPKDQDRPKSTESPDKDRPKAAEQKPKDQPRTTDIPKSSKEPGKDQKATEQRPKDQPRDRSKSTEGPQQGKDTSKSATQRQGERVQVSEQQRTSVRERLTKERRVDKTRINVSVNIGTTIPRSVRLHTLPVAIVSLAPAYRGYSYIVLEDDTICIVEPRTYVIVDVIPAGTQRADRPGRAHLALSADQMRFIFTSVPKQHRADVRVRLALGAEVPRDVELLAFPGVVTERVPEVRRYRYIVSGDDVVVVDPNDNGVVLVINE